MFKDFETNHQDEIVSTEIDKLISIAKTQFEKGEIDKAEEIFIEVLKKDPFNRYAKKGLAVCLFNEKLLDEAETFFRDLLKDSPNDPEINNNLGKTLIEKNKIKNGIEFLRKAIEFAPYNAHYICDLGDAQLKSLQYGFNTTEEKEGINNIHKTLEIIPNHVQGHKVLTNHYFRLSEYYINNENQPSKAQMNTLTLYLDKAYYHANQAIQYSKEKPSLEISKKLMILSSRLNYAIESIIWAIYILEAEVNMLDDDLNRPLSNESYLDKDAFLAIAQNLEKIDAKQYSEQIIQCFKAYCALYDDKVKNDDKKEQYLFDKYGVRIKDYNRELPFNKSEIQEMISQIKKMLLN